jgi:transposase
MRTVRTARGPRHQVVSRLGKLDTCSVQSARDWSQIDELLEERVGPRQMQLGEERVKAEPQWLEVDISSLRVERMRQFGRVYLGLVLWRRLGLHKLLEELMPSGQEDISWDLTGCILTLGRFCAQPSELGVAERWYEDTALEDLLGVPLEKINESRLYRGLDALHPHKDAICKHLLGRYRDWFGVRFEFLLYDVTSTFFEGQALGNEKAQRGYSRDQRPDCKQVCIGMVVTPEGLPVAYEVFAGNRADVTTVEEIVTAMEEKYGQAQRVWVLDRGMVSEENLAWLRARKALYLVGTPKAQLKRHEALLLEQEGWHQVQPGLEVRLVQGDEADERFILCRSQARAQKERAMLLSKVERLRGELEKINRSLQARPQSDLEKVGRRIGRWLGKYPAACAVFKVTLLKDQNGHACALNISERTEKLEWSRLAHGAYLLRSNYPSDDPAQLWKWYIQLTQAEAAFRTAKSDLLLRPVFHQSTQRVESHILVSFLSLVLWRSLEQWMAAKGLGTCARQLLFELDELRSMDVVLPARNGIEVRVRTLAQPEKPLAVLLAHLGLQLPQKPQILGNVVPKIASKKTQNIDNQQNHLHN